MKTLLLTKGYAAFRAGAFLVYQTTVVPIGVKWIMRRGRAVLAVRVHRVQANQNPQNLPGLAVILSKLPSGSSDTDTMVL